MLIRPNASDIVRPRGFEKGNAYLSGGMQFAKDLGGAWREECSKELLNMGYFPLDITELDVAYNKAFCKPEMPKTSEEIAKYKAEMRRHFIEADLKLIHDNSDFLIVYYDESASRGAGTISEAQYAYLYGIPVFLVGDYQTEDDMLNDISGWLLALCTKHFTKFEDLYAYLGSLPEGVVTKDQYGNTGRNSQYLCSLTGDVFTKKKTPFVSNVHPLLSPESVKITAKVYEKNRYSFFREYLTNKTGTQF